MNATIELLLKCRAGEYPVNDFLDQHKGLVAYIVNKRYLTNSKFQLSAMGLADDDLIQTGMIGMWKAYQSFNPESGYKWATYAAKCIKNQIGQLLRDARRDKRYNPNVTSIDNPELREAIPSEFDDLDDTIDRMYLEDKMNKVRPLLSPAQNRVLQAMLDNPEANTVQVAEILNLTQPYVSKCRKIIADKGRLVS
ncbi:RNA polymerase sigma-35 factor precursor [compost metagenome]